MTSDQEMVSRNIELSAEFSRYLFDHPEIEEQIPADAEVILLPEYDASLKEFDLKVGRDVEARGGRVAYISIESMRPKRLSRIEHLELARVS